MDVDEAKASGAMALFGEKYGDKVRVVKMGDAGVEFSRELCGGLHVQNTGNIGMVKIVSESSVSAGVRRFAKTQNLEKSLQSVKLELATLAAAELLNGGINVMGVNLYVRELSLPDEKYKNLLDGVQNKLDVDSVAVIANKDNGSGSIAVMVGKNVQAKGIKAGDIVKDLAKACNGKGGGRPDRAQAGTREPEKIAEAIANANNWIRAKLGA